MRIKWIASAVAILLVSGSMLAGAAGTDAPRPLYMCVSADGVAQPRYAGLFVPSCRNATDKIYTWDVTLHPPTTPPTTATTIPPTTSTTQATTTTTTAPTTTTTAPTAVCVGVPLTNGQATIDANPSGTTYCLSGTHQWQLTPQFRDKIISDPKNPGVLDGGKVLPWGIRFNPNGPLPGYEVTLDGIEVRNYIPRSQQAAIYSGGGWIVKNVQAHDNGTIGLTQDAGGYGMAIGHNVQVLGGRYYNNRQLGLGGGGASGSVLDGIELDHNNFTDNTYTKININCGYEGGGIKWAVVTNFTVKNSKIHDNACAGLWADVYNHDSVITNNDVWGNGGVGIFIEISHGAKISNNRVWKNGFPVGPTDSNPGNWPNWQCVYSPWQSSGILTAASDNVEIWNNTVTDNCAGITASQQTRGPDPDLDPVDHLLIHYYVHDNIISGKGYTGAVTDNGTDLSTRDLVWKNNQFLNGQVFCGITC